MRIPDLLFLTAALALAGCAGLPTEGDADDAALEFFRGQLAEADRYEDRARRVSHLDALAIPHFEQPPLRDLAARERGAALALASVGSTDFARHGGAFYETLRNVPPHLTSDREQALACLGSVANDGDCDGLLRAVVRRARRVCGGQPQWGASIANAARNHLDGLSGEVCLAALGGDARATERAFVKAAYYAKRYDLPMTACAPGESGDLTARVVGCALDRIASGEER